MPLSKRRVLVSFFALCLLFCICLAYIGGGNTVQANEEEFDMQEFTLTHLTATDALGRTLPKVSGYKSDKYVGLFYFLWHGQHNPGSTVRNVTDLLKTNYDDLFDRDPENEVVPEKAWLHVNEPLYGYYNSEDEWVMRKHIELFIASDVDFVMMDFTNGYFYTKPLLQFLDLLLEYKEAGWDVPKVSFYLWIDGDRLAQRLIKAVYDNEEYKDLVFYGNSDKPIIAATIDQSQNHAVSQEIMDYFDVRQGDVSYGKDHERLWPYWQFKRDWQVYVDMVNVSSAQAGNAFSFAYEPGPSGYSNEVHGRGWSSANPVNGDVEAILRGDNIQEGWDAAISKDPDIVFVCGWNEWVVQKMYLPDGSVHYTDNFSVEFSRDIEMLKSATYVKGADGTYTEEGFGDNYYLQLANNVRRFKGILTEEDGFAAPTKKTIDINGNLSQWDSVKETYLAISTNKEDRNAEGFYEGLVYTQAAPENVVEQVQVAYDDNYIYFNITTQNDITAHKKGKTNWMNLFIGVEGSENPAWETFNYVVNRNPVSDTNTSLERFTKDGEYTVASVGEVSYTVSGKVMQIAIPRESLGITEDGFNLTFKVADSIEKESDILDYYVSGESFPVGRMAYMYNTTYTQSGQDPETPPQEKNATGLIAGMAAAGSVAVAGGITAGVCIIKKRKGKK